MLQETEDRHGEAQARCHLGVIHFRQGNMENAKTEFAKLLQLAQQMDNKTMTNVAMVNMAGVLATVEELSKSTDSQMHATFLQ
jgi:Flp pilus assembly protein TadD